VIALVFGGHEERYREFCEAVRGFVPAETAAVLRGSAVTGERWEDGAPFDADGPGTSDLDLTLVGTEILELYDAERGFYIPGVHTKPLSDAEPDVAPRLTPLRRRLMEMVGRPVNIQATRDFVLLLRERLMRQPYLTLVGSVEGASA
jgi:predicted nucleotidyltransferase